MPNAGTSWIEMRYVSREQWNTRDVGAHTFVTESLEPSAINGGVPARALKRRSRDLLELERQLLEGEAG